MRGDVVTCVTAPEEKYMQNYVTISGAASFLASCSKANDGLVQVRLGWLPDIIYCLSWNSTGKPPYQMQRAV